MTFQHVRSRLFARTKLVVSLVTIFVAIGSCEFNPTDASLPGARRFHGGWRSVATVRVSPRWPSLVVGRTVQLTASLRDGRGRTLTDRLVTWETSDAALATVSDNGLVTAVAAGVGTIAATSEGESGTARVTITAAPVASVNVTPASASLSAGQTVQLTATPMDKDGNPLAGRTVTWQSGATAVATVDSSGLVTAAGAGSTKIAAVSEGTSGWATIAVSVVPTPVASVSVSPSPATVAAGQSVPLTATLKDADGSALAGRDVIWTTSDAGLATVSGSGLVDGVAPGSAIITATSEGQSGTSALTITPPPVASVSVNPPSATVTAGRTVQLTATLHDASGNVLVGRVVTWTTNNAAIATTSGDGVVLGVAAGAATITATSEGKSGTATVSVTPIPVASVSVSPTPASVAAGQNVQLTATPHDASGNLLAGRLVTWASDNLAVATVNGSGLVTGVTAGAATITATCEGMNGTAALNVTVAPVASVSVGPATTSVVVGQSVQYTATLRDASGHLLAGRFVTWASDNMAVATIDGTGLATTLGPGSASITAMSEGVNGSAAVTVVPVATGAVFPLHVAAAKRYLIDAQGNPFLIQGDAPWSLIVQLTNEEAEQYLEARRQQGFNTIFMNLIEHYFSDDPPRNAYGEAPFTTPGDFAMPNEAYFSHAAEIITMAAQKGMLVMLTPAYMGYGGGNEGWYHEMVANGTAKLANYGTYLANRFAAFDNIMWVSGGDYAPPNLNILGAIPNAIRAAQSKWLHTFHASRGIAALEYLNPPPPWLDVNTIYTDQDPIPSARQEYARSDMPFFLIEAVYENEGADEVVVRKQAYQTVLQGGMGHLMGNRPIWLFDPGWESALNSPGATTLSHLPPLLTNRAWWTMVPDVNHVVVTKTAATTGRASDGSFVLSYLPHGGSVTANLSQLSGPNVAARWYDPANGTYKTISGSPFPASGSHSFASAGTNSSGYTDWVLVLESAP